MTILMVEQNARLALRVSDRAYVLSTGSVVLEGRAQDLLEDEAVRKAYLG
jgi:branched-chain amino acid transport system ATP-binding protein